MERVVVGIIITSSCVPVYGWSVCVRSYVDKCLNLPTNKFLSSALCSAGAVTGPGDHLCG